MTQGVDITLNQNNDLDDTPRTPLQAIVDNGVPNSVPHVLPIERDANSSNHGALIARFMQAAADNGIAADVGGAGAGQVDGVHPLTPVTPESAAVDEPFVDEIIDLSTSSGCSSREAPNPVSGVCPINLTLNRGESCPIGAEQSRARVVRRGGVEQEGDCLVAGQIGRAHV